MRTTYSLDLRVPVPAAFEWVIDDAKMAQWMEGLERIDYLTDKNPNDPVGTRFRQWIREGGRLREYHGKVIAYAYPQLLAIEIGNQSFSTTVHYRFRESSTGTQLDYESEITFHNPLLRAFGFLFAGFAKGILRQQLEKLKQVAEQG